MRRQQGAKRTLCLLCGFIVCAFLSCLANCQPNGADTPFDIYLVKLNKIPRAANPATMLTSAPLLPEPAVWHLNIDSANEGVVDFMDLRGCALQSTIIRQNSHLGRKAKPSQRLLLELEYLQLAPACILRLRERNNTTLAETLEQRRQLQQRQLPALIFNATLAGKEFRSFWQGSPTPGQYPPVEPNVALSAVETINCHIRRWLAGDYRAQQREFEVLLSEVAGGSGGAVLEQEKAHFYRELHTAITILEAQLAPSLPSQYRSWKAQRSETLARMEHAQQYQPKKNLERAGKNCTVD